MAAILTTVARLIALLLTITTCIINGQQSCTWNTITNSFSPMGTSQSSATSLAACQSACQSALSNCQNFGLDWDSSKPSGNQCYLSTSTTLYNGSSPNVNHYAYVCTSPTVATVSPAPGTCYWNASANSNSPSGTVQSSINNLADCQNGCYTNSACLGFDWNPNVAQGQMCWFSDPAQPISYNKYPGVTHYQWTCPPSPSTVTPTMAPPTPTMSIQQTLPPGCSVNPVANSNSPNGNLQTSISNLQDCTNQCPGSSSCKTYGFDWVAASNQCWYSTSSTVNSGSNGVTHYNYVCSSVGPTITAGPPTLSMAPTISPNPSTTGIGGNSRSSSTAASGVFIGTLLLFKLFI